MITRPILRTKGTKYTLPFPKYTNTTLVIQQMQLFNEVNKVLGIYITYYTNYCITVT